MRTPLSHPRAAGTRADRGLPVSAASGGRARSFRLRAIGGAPAVGRPSWTERILYGALILLALTGVVSPGEYHYNLLPAGSLLELALLASAALLAARITRGAWPILVVGGLYVVLKTLTWATYSPAALADFLQAYKAYIYLVVLAFFVGRKVFQARRLAHFTVLLVAAFLIKYGYSVVLGLAQRPGVYIENNFELILLMGLVYLAWPYLGPRRNWVFAGLAVTVLLSGSRSAAIALLVVYVFLYVRTSNRTWPLHIAGVAAVGYAVFELIASRLSDDGGLARLDRLNFLNVYLGEVDRWPVWTFLTGSLPLTPLSPGGCADLAFYAPLFSTADPGTCYSVILHSFVLRALFDQGVIGLVLLYALVWLGLRRSGASVRDTIALLAPITASAFSVSAFNSVFTAILLAIAMGLDRTAPAEPPEPAGRRGWSVRRSSPGGMHPGASRRAAAVRRQVADAAQ